MPSPSEKPRSSLKAILLAGLSVNQIYILASAVLVLSVARVFYGSLKMQTEHVDLWFQPEKVWAIFEGLRPPRWSAPLDDVFIHFDFARATARGYPLEWIEGNGYSSGGTSLLYPFLLAIGFVAGNLGLDLMHWAGILACVGTFATLLGAKRLFKGLPEWTALAAPVCMLSVGALNWTLFSGMEVAVFLAFWALSFVLWDDLATACEHGLETHKRALALGLACALLVASRPESAPIVAVYGLWAGYLHFQKTKSPRSTISNILLVGVPGAVVLIGQMLVNKALTGDSAAAGALAKLEMHHPYLTSGQVLDSWVFFLKYQFLRLSNHHFSAIAGVGYFVWPLALAPLLFKQTRRTGLVIWLSIIFWVCLVALNGQVRWQNERYTMPAVAWLLLLAALGMGATFAWALDEGRAFWAKYTALLVPSCMAIVFAFGQAPRYRDQVWFFGRAARNILEQHVRAGSYLADPEKNVRRVLLSDAGAIPYVSDLPAFDLIGLGGYGRLPIARASRQGVGAALELFRYVPPGDLPDVMALYPSWWDDFVLWFGMRVGEFPVRGNVICGGASKVIYAPRWAPLLHSDEPITIAADERLVDSLDIADIISEKAHAFSWDRPAQGYVDMKILPDVRNPKRDLWDAGRLLSTQMSFDFELSGFKANKSFLLIRAAPAQEAQLELSVSGAPVGVISVLPADHWQELRVELPQVRPTESFSLRAVEGALHLYHLFAVEPARAKE